jgi:hypothetical protein
MRRTIHEIEREIHAAKAEYLTMGEATPEWKAFAAKASRSCARSWPLGGNPPRTSRSRHS